MKEFKANDLTKSDSSPSRGSVSSSNLKKRVKMSFDKELTILLETSEGLKKQKTVDLPKPDQFSLEHTKYKN